MSYLVAKACPFCRVALSSRERQRHRCGDRLEIINADGARTLVIWSTGDLSAWMADYVALLTKREMPANTMPVSAAIVSRGGRPMDRWAA